MYNSDLKNKIFLNYFYLKKKYLYIRKINKYIFKLKNIFTKKQKYKISFLKNLQNLKNKRLLKGLLVMYIVHFSFSATNTFLHITDTSGNLKFHYSAGLLEFRGKQKKVRIVVLSSFFHILRQLRISLLKNKPIALHLNNVGSYRYFIIRKLKKYFFIRIVKNYELYPYNGCRKKKKVRKRQRFKKR